MFNNKKLKRVTTDFGHSLTCHPDYVAEIASLKNSDAAKTAVFLLTNPKRKSWINYINSIFNWFTWFSWQLIKIIE
jgi:hypothetical protein